MSAFASASFSIGGFSPAAFAFDTVADTPTAVSGWPGDPYYPRHRQTEAELRQERIRLGIIPPDVEKAVSKAVEGARAERKTPDVAKDIQAAENALRADMARLDRQLTDDMRRLLYIEYALREMEFEEAQVVMLLFDM